MYGDYYDVASTTGVAAGAGAALAGIIIVWLIIGLAVAIFSIITMWKMFEKAGKPGWAAIVPVYNLIILLDIIGYKWYYVFCFCLGAVPIIGSIAVLLFAITMNIKLAKSFGKDVPFGIGCTFLSLIFYAIIAFSKDIKYVGPAVKGDIDFNDLF